MGAKHEVQSRVLGDRSIFSCAQGRRPLNKLAKFSPSLPAFLSTSHHPKELRALIQTTGRMTWSPSHKQNNFPLDLKPSRIFLGSEDVLTEKAKGLGEGLKGWKTECLLQCA